MTKQFEQILGIDRLDQVPGISSAPGLCPAGLRMPVLDGRMTLHAIREALELTDLKVFAVSGSSPESMGIDDAHLRWFPKPLDTERLVRAMTESTGLTQTPV